MAYLGKQPVLVSTEFRDEFNITSTANTVVTSGFVNSGSSNYLEVYKNGVLLGSSDYTLSTDNKTINLVDSAASGDIIVVTGRREINQGLKVTERRHEHVIQSGETTVTFPFPLTVDGTDVHINGIKLWYGNGSGDGTNSDFAINVNTKVVSFGVNPSVGDVVCIVSREPSATTSTPLPITNSNGASVLSEINGKVTLNNTNLGGSVVPNSSFMFRNKIINGEMRVNQRGNSTLINETSYRACDRYHFVITDGGYWSISQSTDSPEGFGSSYKLECTTAKSTLTNDSRLLIIQKIEGQNLQDLKKGTADAKSVTLSFYVKTSLAGTYQVNLEDNDNIRIIGNTYTISSSEVNTWQYKTFTFPGDTTGALDNDNMDSLALHFVLVAGNGNSIGSLPTAWQAKTNTDRGAGLTVNLAATVGNTWQITGVQLEEGTVATPFEHRPHGLEKSLCQRYFMKVDGRAIAYRRHDTNCTCFMTLPECMRLKQPVLKNITKGILSNMQTQGFGTINDNSIAAGGESEMIDRGFLYIEFTTNNSGHTFIPSWEGFNFDVDAEL